MTTTPPADSPDDLEPVAVIEPLDVDGVHTVAAGSALWLVALLALLPFVQTLRESGRLSWLWICLVGFGLGLVGIEYCRRRRRAIRAAPARVRSPRRRRS